MRKFRPLLSRHLSFSSFHFDAFCTRAPRGLGVWSCLLGLGYYLRGEESDWTEWFRPGDSAGHLLGITSLSVAEVSSLAGRLAAAAAVRFVCSLVAPDETLG